MIIIIVSICIIIGMLILLKLSLQENIVDTKLLAQIEQLLSKKMNLQDSILFLDFVRAFTMTLVQKSQQQKYPKPLQKITHQLLGLVLKIPRMSEQDNDNDLVQAFKQIGTITEVSEEIKSFFNKNLPTLKKY